VTRKVRVVGEHAERAAARLRFAYTHFSAETARFLHRNELEPLFHR
jgi:hypothetical protein